jgi:hypothetical protein
LEIAIEGRKIAEASCADAGLTCFSASFGGATKAFLNE